MDEVMNWQQAIYGSVSHSCAGVERNRHSRFRKLPPYGLWTWSLEILLRRVAPLIARQDTVLSLSIQPEERLAITLRWLAMDPLCLTFQLQ